MKTILKRIFLGTLVLSLCMQNVSAFSYDFSRLSLSNVATSLWNTISEHPKTVLGVIGATLGLAAVYKYFSPKNVIKPEGQPQIQPEPIVPDINLNQGSQIQVEEHSTEQSETGASIEIMEEHSALSVEEQSETEEMLESQEEPSAFEQISDIDEMHQKYNQLLAHFDGNGKVILENLNARLETYTNNGALINRISDLRQNSSNFDSDFGPFKDQKEKLMLNTVLQQQNNDFAGVLWRNHPRFNGTQLVRFSGGYWFFHVGSGQHNGESLKNRFSFDPEKLVQNYKIHLMPQGRDVNTIVSVLLRELEINKLFRQSVQTFKVKAWMDSIEALKNKNGDIMPMIVIYPSSGKHNAQYVLDVVRCLFKDYEGTGIAPRYNQKVNDLIYFAQGDGDFKGDLYRHYYENDAQVYYRSNLTPSGSNNGYHLNFEKLLEQCANSNEYKEAQHEWLAASVTVPERINFKNTEIVDVKIDGDEWLDIQQKLNLAVTDDHQYSLTKRIIRPSLQGNGTITFVCVHGTYSSDNKFGRELNQRNSQALLEYAKRLAYTHEKSVEMISFTWSGQLNLSARKDAGHVLANMLVDHMNKNSEQIIVYAHSHGCNVSSLAAQAYNDLTGGKRRFNKAIYCASPTSDVVYNVCAQVDKIYHFYGSADVAQVLGSFQSHLNFDRKLPVSANVHNIRLMHETKDLDHADIKHHVSRNMWNLMETIDRYYPYHYDLDASVTDDPVVNYVAVRNSIIHGNNIGQDVMDTALEYSASREQAFKDDFGGDIHNKNIYEDRNAVTAFLYMAYGEYNSRKMY